MNLHPSCLQTLDHASHILSQAAGLSETEVSRATANIDSLRSKAIVARRLGTLKRMDAESDRQRSEADEKRRKIEYEENRRRLQALEELIAEKAKNNYIHLLPRDVVIMICQTGMERGDSALQVKMAAVNKQWREWINSDAGLWQTLKLGQKKPIVKTRLWMERSQGRLRRLIIDPKFDREHFPALRAELGSNAAEHLDALEVQQHVFKDVRLGFQKFFRNLRHLTLAFDERSRSERDRSIPDLLAEPDEVENRQPLQELVVEGPLPMLLPPAGSLHMAELRNCDRLQWATIRKLYLKHFAVVRPAAWGARSLGFLGRMRDVEEIGLVSVVDYPEAGHVLDQQETDHAPVVLERLWRYTEQDRRGITRCPFSTISTPNLTHLALCNFRGNVWHSLIDTNLYRVLPNLVYLDVSNNCLLEHRLLEVIHHTTSLRYLGVSGCPVGPAFLEALIRTDNEEDSLLPNLTALSIGCNEELPGVLLKDVVISRLPRHLKGSLQKKLQTAQKAPEPPKIRSAFAPKLSSKVKQQPASVAPPSTQTTAANTDKPDLARLTWLCLDGCNGLDAELVGALQKRVRTVLWSSAAKDEDRLRGQGRYAWDAEYGTDCTSDCHLRRTPGELPLVAARRGACACETVLTSQVRIRGSCTTCVARGTRRGWRRARICTGGGRRATARCRVIGA